MALRGASDTIVMIEMPRSREPKSTRSRIKARAQMGAIDHVSEIERSRLIAISAIVGRHMDASGFFDHDRTA